MVVEWGVARTAPSLEGPPSPCEVPWTRPLAPGDPGPCLELGSVPTQSSRACTGRFRGSQGWWEVTAPALGQECDPSRPFPAPVFLAQHHTRLMSRGQPGRHFLGTSEILAEAHAGHWRSPVLQSHRMRALSPCWLPAGVTFRSQRPRLGACTWTLQVDPASLKPAAVQCVEGGVDK